MKCIVFLQGISFITGAEFESAETTKGMLQNSTFVGLALPLFLITFFSYLVWLQFFRFLSLLIILLADGFLNVSGAKSSGAFQ